MILNAILVLVTSCLSAVLARLATETTCGESP